MREVLVLDVVESAPDGVDGVGIERLEGTDDIVHIRSMGLVLIRTELLLPMIAPELGIAAQIGLADKTERADHLHRELIHLQEGRDSANSALEREVHQEGMDDIVAMMTEGYLVAAPRLSHLKQGLAAIPGAEETMGLAMVGRGVEGGNVMNELYPTLLTERTEIVDIGAIADRIDRDVNRHHSDTRHTDTRLATEELDERQRVLAAGETDEDDIAIGEETILLAALVEKAEKTLREANMF